MLTANNLADRYVKEAKKMVDCVNLEVKSMKKCRQLMDMSKYLNIFKN